MQALEFFQVAACRQQEDAAVPAIGAAIEILLGRGRIGLFDEAVDDTDVIADMRGDAEYRIAGRVQRYKPGSPITLKQCNIREQTAGPSGPAPAPAGKKAAAAGRSLAALFPRSEPLAPPARWPAGPRILAGDPARGELSVPSPCMWSYA